VLERCTDQTLIDEGSEWKETTYPGRKERYQAS
jgi:hypothetical protein